jgi:uncharacterized protein
VANLVKHGVDFSIACRVFDDVFADDFEDSSMNYGEERRIAIGMVEGQVFAVVYVDRGDVIRIVSARKATRQERQWYAEGRQED